MEPNTAILLVDDEVDFLHTLAKRLALRKLAVMTAENGPDALGLLGEHLVDVVVVDVKMPGMDGIQVVREIKRHHPLVEVILLTGHADLEASLEGMTAGAFDYLLKPVAIDDLVYKIEDAKTRKDMQEKKIGQLKERAGQLRQS
ncbi:MAG: response regulator [Deltaproteobacteria bacterium]|nr:response regulator [Deltaproteobacteria bacterium]